MADLTVSQVRAARALLAWSQQDLAKAAQVASSTVADFERGHRNPMPNNAEAMRKALEAEGIHFIGGGAVLDMPSSAFAADARQGAPVRWITAADLSDWADRRDGQAELPQLISRLALATYGPQVALRFPSGDSVGFPGWDGVLDAPVADSLFPVGKSVWEIGTQREKIRDKADKDYTKRTADPLGLDPKSATYVFVTPRRWPGKQQWMAARATEGRWADVLALDGDDLVHALDRYTSVAHWLAHRIGKRPDGLRLLDEIWKEWSLATQRPLTRDLILAGRADQASAVMKWLRAAPSVLPLRAESTEEALAFLYAAIAELPPPQATALLGRTIAPTADDAARLVGDGLSGSILAVAEADPGLAQSLADKGHHVFVALDPAAADSPSLVTLPRAHRYDISRGLEAMGFERSAADSLARDSGRSLTVLRRLIPNVPGRRPAWSISPSRSLLAALLVGGWNEDSAEDQALVAGLAGQTYSDVVQELSAHAARPDGPVRRSEGVWKMTSPRDAWLLLSPHLSVENVNGLLTAFQTAMSAPDPRYDLDSEDRWLAAVKGVVPPYSSMLRRGLTETLILLSLHGDRIPGLTDPVARVDGAVSRLLSGADSRLWWSLSHDFQRLAEAAPSAFLTALEDALEDAPSPLSDLFVADKGGFHGADYLPDLLWALERLAWSVTLFGRVCDVLARLAAIDPGGKSLNRPENTLRNLFLLWSPQTYATLSERLRVLDRLRTAHAAEAWALLVAIGPRGRDFMSPNAHPQWRDYTIDGPEVVTPDLMARGAQAVIDRLIEDVGQDADRWSRMIELIEQVVPVQRRAIVARLRQAIADMGEEDDRARTRAALRQLLFRHRQYPDADWSLDESTLSDIETVYEALEPKDPVKTLAWLFNHQVQLPRPVATGFREQNREIEALRHRAVAGLLETARDRLADLAAVVEAPGFIGKALFESAAENAFAQDLVARGLSGDDMALASLAHGYVATAQAALGLDWAERLIDTMRGAENPETAIGRILRALPERRDTWSLAARQGPTIDDAYWRGASVIWIDGDRDDIIHAAERMLSLGRARHASHLVGHHLELDLPTPLLQRILVEAARQEPPQGDDIADHNEMTMFNHHVSEMLGRIEADPDVDEGAVAGLEWTYFSLLRYSGRGMKTFHKVMAHEPTLFLQLINTVYPPAKDSGVDRDEAQGVASALVSQAFNVLEDWSRVPGSTDAGEIDAAQLEAWVKTARIGAAASGRSVIADFRIGHILAASGDGLDGLWPAEAVRDVIDLTRSKDLEAGLRNGVLNRRGVTVRDPEAGGSLERSLAARYERLARGTALEWPRTSAVLNSLAEYYLADARREDEQVERRQWI